MAEVYAGDIRAGVPPLVREHQPAGQVTEQLRLLEIRIGWGVPCGPQNEAGTDFELGAVEKVRPLVGPDRGEVGIEQTRALSDPSR
jgi:hypothetical protein